MNLEDLRQQIDSIDREIVERLNQRVLLASEIGKIKARTGAGMYVPVREEEVFRKLEQFKGDGPLDSGAIRAIYREVISASIAPRTSCAVAPPRGDRGMPGFSLGRLFILITNY